MSTAEHAKQVANNPTTGAIYAVNKEPIAIPALPTKDEPVMVFSTLSIEFSIAILFNR